MMKPSRRALVYALLFACLPALTACLSKPRMPAEKCVVHSTGNGKPGLVECS